MAKEVEEGVVVLELRMVVALGAANVRLGSTYDGGGVVAEAEELAKDKAGAEICDTVTGTVAVSEGTK